MDDRKTIVLRTPDQAEAVAKLSSHLVGRKKPWCVTFDKYDTKRTKEQNSLIWHLASLFAANSKHFGVEMNKTKWYYCFSTMFLDPVIITDFRTGEVKEVAQSMSNLTKKTFGYVLDKIYEFAHDYKFPLPVSNELLAQYGLER